MLKKAMTTIALGLSLCCIPFMYSYAAQAYGYREYVKADEVLQAGTVIPATLVTPVVSDNMSTTIIAVVRQNVYDTVTGSNILIPAGTKLIGDPMLVQKKRIDISFNRLIFPNGRSVDLPDYRAIDSLGYSGISDKYDSHTWLRMRSVLLGAISAGAVSGFSYSDSDNTYNSVTDSYENRTSAADEAKKSAIAEILSSINDMVKRDNDALAPTVTVREGYQFNVILNTDIRIKPYSF